MFRPILPILFAGLAAALSGCGGTGGGPGRGAYDYSMKPKENDFDRTGFGTSPLAFWMGLTEPEVRALQRKDKAAAGDPAALLDLAILASGSPRASAGYDSIHGRVDAFVAKVRPAVEGEKTAYRKGLKLFQAMHAEFFPAPRTTAKGPATGAEAATPEAAGYDYDHSDLSAIFTRRKFNCISSALLYVVLGRHFGLEMKGVLMETHAFAQINTPEGKLIEVETTSPTGYDWVHDEEFYAKKAGSFFGARGLPPGTFKDYQARAVLDPIQLVAHNMNNQHLAPARIPQADRCRLAEARAFIAPKDREAQQNRLDLYNTEYLWLKRSKDFATVEAMWSKVKPVLTEVRGNFAGDDEMTNHLAWAWFEYASTLNELGRGPEGIPYVDSSLACVRKGGKQGPAVFGNDVALIQAVAAGRAEKGELAEAETLLLRYPEIAKEDASYRRTLAWLYNKWAVTLWNKEDWEGAIAKFERQKEAGEVGERKSVMDNMINAYLNWAVGFQNQSDWPGVRSVLAKCVEKTQARKCRTLLDQVVAQHKLD